jgi:hypothetical protein
MYRAKTTVEGLLKAVRKHCTECNGGHPRTCKEKNCTWWPYRLLRTTKADQTHMFRENDIVAFFEKCDRALGDKTLITANEMRKLLDVVPLKPNWLGAWFLRLQKRGWVREGSELAAHDCAHGRRVGLWIKGKSA